MRVAIIGAGMTGASAARQLAEAGAEVFVFDKARGPGGRMSSKRVLHSQLDFGAQYFTAQSPEFAAQITRWLDDKTIVPWSFNAYCYDKSGLKPSPDQQQRYIGIPSMHQVVRQLLGQIPQYYQCQITELQFSQSSVSSLSHGQWTLSTKDGASYAGFDAVLLTCPPAQSQQLLCNVSSAPQLQNDILQPSWAVLLTLSQDVQHPAEAIFSQVGPISWACRQKNKPGRSQLDHEQWIVHVSSPVSLDLLDATPEEVVAIVSVELSLILGEQVQVVDSLCHRWLYARLAPEVKPLGILQSGSLYLAGDWSLGNSVEHAYLAGQQVAAAMLSDGR